MVVRWWLNSNELHVTEVKGPFEMTPLIPYETVGWTAFTLKHKYKLMLTMKLLHDISTIPSLWVAVYMRKDPCVSAA